MKNLTKILLLLSLFIGFSSIHADENFPDNFQLRLGGYILADQDTDVELTRNGSGATLNLQDRFNMKKTTQVVRLDGYYRFSHSHGIEFSWYSIKNNSQTNKDFKWGDSNISVSGELNTFFDTDIYKVNYLYSFYNSSKVELALAIGLHVTALNIGFDGTYLSNRSTNNSGESIKLTAPLPVAGFRLRYNIFPQWSVNYSIDYFFLTFDGFQGALSDSTLTTEYRLFKHFGLGIGINSTRMRLEATTSDNTLFKVNHDVLGGLIYGTVNF